MQESLMNNHTAKEQTTIQQNNGNVFRYAATAGLDCAMGREYSEYLDNC